MCLFRRFLLAATLGCAAFPLSAQHSAPPENLEIYEPNQESVHLSWVDVAGDETSYLVERRYSPEEAWQRATLPPNTEVFRDIPDIAETEVEYRVAAFKTGQDINTITWVSTSLTRTTGGLDLAYTFVLNNGQLVPVDIPEGFSARANVPFTHQVLFSSGTPDTFTARGLPTNVSINSSTGEITGTVTTTGVLRFFVGVTFDSGKKFEQVRYLRVLPGPVNPVVANPRFSLPKQNLGVEGTLNISSLFRDPARPRGATFETPKGYFTVALFDEATPKTVANFRRYVADRQYNYSILHRADPGLDTNDVGFVIQGGGFYPASNTVPTAWGRIPTYANLPNEPGISNTRGTIAMAKVGGDPDSATSQWFVSIGNNNPAILDRQNGGFTAFGKVVGTGMSVVDALLSLQRGTFSPNVGGVVSSFTNVPVRTATVPSSLGFDSTVYFPSVVESPAVEIKLMNNSNPSILTAQVVGMGLYLKSLNRIGTTRLWLRATNLDGLTADFTLPVTIDDLVRPGIRLLSIQGTTPAGSLIVKGRANDNIGLRSWRYRVNGKRWLNGGRLSGKNKAFTKKMAGFKAGRNRIEVESFDSRGNRSGILTQRFSLR